MRIIFMGSPDFAVPTLDALVEAGHELAAVYTQPPRPAGRGKEERPTPVAVRAELFEALSAQPHREGEDRALGQGASAGRVGHR